MSKPCYIDGKLYTITVSKEAYIAVKKRQAQYALEEKYIRAWQSASELILRGFENIEKINEEKPGSQAEVLPPPLKKRLTKSRNNPTKNLKRKQHSKDSTNFTR